MPWSPTVPRLGLRFVKGRYAESCIGCRSRSTSRLIAWMSSMHACFLSSLILHYLSSSRSRPIKRHDAEFTAIHPMTLHHQQIAQQHLHDLSNEIVYAVGVRVGNRHSTICVTTNIPRGTSDFVLCDYVSSVDLCHTIRFRYSFFRNHLAPNLNSLLAMRWPQILQV
ncbi:hypothetical protein BD410DRAFT_552013 [Rickenella mellea]|uniref:Uncharacterized protein n=1 Tax=Rickenella mellea TaxID=50990 RepID=A0A4Y7PS54_9AGAM|nr:hypothetical protein BD410DRAFT_552013 [Rickenella mellea]